MTIELRLQRQQAKALTCPANELLYGGAAGGGKSHLMRVAAIHYCLAIPGLQAYLFRRTFGEIKKNHMEGPTSFPAFLAPLVQEGKVQILEDQIRFLQTGSKIHLCHLQYSKNLMIYQGAEIHLLLMDELTHFTEDEYRYLRGRVRLGGLHVPAAHAGAVPRIICGTNPGGIGHNWVKKTFVTQGEMRIVPTEKTEGGMRRVFIPARLQDNPALFKNDPTYIDRLEGLGDPLLVRALRDGDWEIVAGSMFGGTWRKDRHEVEPFPIPLGWKMWMGADDGFAAPASVHWFAEDPDTKGVFVVAELHRSGMLPKEMATRIQDTTDNIPMAVQVGDGKQETVLLGNCVHDPIAGLMDSAAFSNTGQAEISRGNQLKAFGIKMRPAEKWAGSRVHRVQNFHRALGPNPRDPKGAPGIRFFRNCRFAIETIPTLPRDKHNYEDVDTDADDHAFDSVTYGLQWRQHKVERVRIHGA